MRFKIAQKNQHQPHGKFHREANTCGNHPAEKNDSASHRKNRQRMSDTPERANHGGVAHFFVARDDRRDSDHVIGISGVAHPEKEAERDDGEQADHFSFEILEELNSRDQVWRADSFMPLSRVTIQQHAAPIRAHYAAPIFLLYAPGRTRPFSC